MRRRPFRNKLRYRMATRAAPFEEPSVGGLGLRLRVAYLTAEAVEYKFPESQVTDVVLLHAPEVSVFPTPCFELPPPVLRAARMLEPEQTTLVDPSFLEMSRVSENLFHPLGKRRIGGKQYPGQDAHEAEDSAFEPTSQDTKGTARVDGYRKSFKQMSRSTRQGPNVWDLVFPLLQAPLDEVFVDILELPPKCTPYAYQWEGIHFLTTREAALLGDDMGTGKTVQSILAARLLFQKGQVQKALFVCPLSVLPHWDREFERWALSLKVTVVRGNAEHRRLCWEMPAHIWITTYDTLRQDKQFLEDTSLEEFDLVVLDEAQRIKNRNSGISKAVRSMKAERRWALTGTPVENKLDELPAIFSFLKPGLFPNRDISRDEAKDRIREYFLRRKKEDVLKDLPTKRENPVPLRLSDEQQSTYDEMERERVVQLHQQGREITAFNILTLIQELKKICNRDPRTGQSVKLTWLLENLEEMTEEGNKVLVFSQYCDERFGGTEWLCQVLSDYGALNYADANSDKKRKDILRRFGDEPATRVFLGNPRTAGLGLNELVAANYVVHFDHWWNPAVTNQATARAHRPGQTKEVVVYHFWVEGTVEDVILKKTREKQQLYDEVIDSLSTEPPEEVLFDVYDELLKKHGFKPLGAGQRRAQTTAIEPDRSPSEMFDSPRELEIAVGKLYESIGYNARVTPYSRDGGVDIVATREVGHSIEKIAVQCKLKSSPVGVQAFRDLLGVISADLSFTKGVLVTNARITEDARQFLRDNGRLQAITGPDLQNLMAKYCPGE